MNARLLRRLLPLLLALSTAAPAVAAGQGKLEAHYVASLAGIPIGKGVWVVNVLDDQYSAAANGKTTGLLQVFAGGHGTATGRGTHSSTSSVAPAASTAWASASTAALPASSLPCTR